MSALRLCVGDTPHPITTPEWMRDDWGGALPDDGSDPVRVAITSHEVRFKGSPSLELCLHKILSSAGLGSYPSATSNAVTMRVWRLNSTPIR